MHAWQLRAGRILRVTMAVIGLASLLDACGGTTMGAAPAAMASVAAAPATMPSTPMAPATTTQSCSAQTCGTALITMTDAKGDFLSYIVSLTSLQLQTAAGATVETIPTTTKVDFTKLVDLSEVLSAGQIPQAEYVAAKLTIDYSNSQISADDGTGNPVALTPVDSTGQPLTGPLSVTVQLDATHHLKINPNDLARLALDFNLAVSNAVDLTADTVTVTPTLVASLAASDTRPVRVRGLLTSTTAAQDQFLVAVQPFQDEGASVGEVTVQVNPATTYQIDGKAYLGDAGLTALAALPMNAKVAAFGTTQSGTAPVIAATNVLAGSSLERAGQDQLSGTVIARNQTTLTVRAATWNEGNGDFDFEQRDAKITIGAGTVVVKQGQTGTFTTADVSVGQHIEAFGAATRGSDHTLTLDTSNGQVRLDVTPAWGVMTSLQTGSVSLALQSLDGLPPMAFDFSGTGSSTATDASANAYVVNTGTLDLSAFAVTGFTGVRGFATPFGSAPPDFTAETLIGLPTLPAQLNVHFDHGGSTTAFAQLTSASTSLLLQLPTANGGSNGNGNGNSGNGNSGNGSGSGSGNSNGSGNSGSNDSNGDGDDSIRIGPQDLDLRNVSSPLSIVPDLSGSSDVFTIGQSGPMHSEMFMDFASFVAVLAGELPGARGVQGVSATGRYDAASNTLTATRIAVVLSN
jgi:hypothetical protein